MTFMLTWKRYWNDLPLRAKGFAVISIPVFALLVSLAVTHSFRQFYHNLEESTRRTVEVSAEIQRTFRLVYEGSAGIRGYILTNRESFLEPYQEALEGLPQSLSKLTSLVQDNPTQTERVQQIKIRVPRLLEGWRGLRTAVQQAPNEAQRMEALATEPLIVLLTDNKVQSDALRGLFEEMLVEEERLLEERTQRVGKVVEVEFAVIGLSALFGLIGGFLALRIFINAILLRINLLKTNAANLAQGQPLQELPSGKDEIGLLGEELTSASLARIELEQDLRERNVELERLNNLKKEFLANTSHELRTPLTAIIGFAELLDLKVFGPLNERQAQYVKNIHDSGNHLLALINDILDLSKIDAGKMKLKLASVDVASVAEGAYILMKERAHEAGLRFETEMPLGLGYTHVQVDTRMLRQVLLNLLSNAIKFTPRDGSVILSVTASRDKVFFEVKDTGIGVALEDQDKLFKEFSQIDSSLSRDHEGTGLGLALSKRLIELHGGDIWVKSEPGKGSTFGFSISRNLGIQQEPPQSKGVAPPKEGNCILIVEDDDGMANLLQTYLEEEGHCTLRAHNGQEGLQMLRQYHPVAVTLDIMMPIMGGYEFLKALSTDPEFLATPIVVVSATEEAKGSFAFGATAVLSKPFNRDELGKTLREVVGAFNEVRTILVADDDPIIISLLSDQLKSLGYKVIAATNGQEALKIGREERPDLLILDLLMPEMSGFEVIAALHEEELLRDIPVMVLTSLDLGEKDKETLAKRVEAISEKRYFDADAFKREVRRIVT